MRHYCQARPELSRVATRPQYPPGCETQAVEGGASVGTRESQESRWSVHRPPWLEAQYWVSCAARHTPSVPALPDWLLARWGSPAGTRPCRRWVRCWAEKRRKVYTTAAHWADQGTAQGVESFSRPPALRSRWESYGSVVDP